MWMLSLPSTPTQNSVLGHERPNIATSLCEVTRTGVHDPEPPVGSVDTRAEFENAPMTQNELLGHATLSKRGIPVMSALRFVSVHALVPAGSVEVATLPRSSTAAQRKALGHEMAEKSAEP